MKLHFIIYIILLSALYPCIAEAQCTSSQPKPKWVDGFFQEHSNSYIESVSATGYTEAEARNKAANIAVERRSLATGKRISVEVKGDNVLVSGNDNLTVKSRIIDEYRESCNDGQYRVSLLVQTAKNPTYEFEQVNVTEKYPFSARVFVPGMSQLHKGSTGKGVFFIASEVSCVAGIVIAESLRSSNTSKINKTHSESQRKDYINKADNAKNIRNGFIVAASAIYLWNIIDGVAANGKKRVFVQDRAHVQIAPYTTGKEAGFALALTF